MRKEQNMSTMRRCRTYAKVGLMLAVLASASSAAARGRYQIKSLKGETYQEADSWRVALRYDVRIKEYDPQIEYQLILNLIEDGRTLQDENGQPLQQVVVLCEPKINKKGEAQFTGPADGNVAAGMVQNIKKLRVQATLYVVGDNQVLASKQTGLKVRKEPRKER